MVYHTLCQAALTYKKPYEASDLSKYRWSYTDPGTGRRQTNEAEQFSGGSVEELLFCKQRVMDALRRQNIPVAQNRTEFRATLSGEPADTFDDVVAAGDTASDNLGNVWPQTQAGFDRLIKAFAARYMGNTRAARTQVEAFKSQEFRYSHGKEEDKGLRPTGHIRRLRELFRMVPELQGFTAFSEEDQKDTIFSTFPRTWQESVWPRYDSLTIPQLGAAMEFEAIKASRKDEQTNKKNKERQKKQNEQQAGRYSGRGRGGRGRGRGRGRFNNWQPYGQYQGGRGNRGGRGWNRGGRNSGRGGRGRSGGRDNYNFQNQYNFQQGQRTQSHFQQQELPPPPTESYYNNGDHSAQDEADMKLLSESFFIPTPKTTRRRTDLAPICLAKIRTVGTTKLDWPLVALLDPGSTSTLIQLRSLPPGCKPKISPIRTVTTTANGQFETNTYVGLETIQLPEFVNGRVVDGVPEARLFDSPHCQYDIIFGRDFLRRAGIKFCFETETVHWMDAKIIMKPTNHYTAAIDVKDCGINQQSLFVDWLGEMATLVKEETGDAVVFDELFQSEMLARAYGKVSTEEVSMKQKHLNEEQQCRLQAVLDKRKTLFDGKLGRYPHKQFHIELEPDAKPEWQRAYPIPFRYRKVFEEEIQEMIKDDILPRKHSGSRWCSPSFPTPKKDNRVRFVTDYRRLNRHVIRRPYPMPKIQEIMQNCRNYSYFTKIDLSMMFYCFELDEQSRNLTTTMAPDGTLLEYNVCPMGLKISPDFAQAAIEEILQGLDVVAYIDDVGIFSDGNYDEHLALVATVLVKTNPLKCEWAVQNTDFLGYDMTPTSCKPMQSKIEALLRISRPRNKREVRGFLGGINFYNTMFPRRTQVLNPLTALTRDDTPFRWGKTEEDAFIEMKAILASDCMNAYPDLNKPFDIVCDASDYQLGSCILQDGRPIDYWSKRLTSAQKNYSTCEKELLAIVLTLKQYRRMLLGGSLRIYTNHKNLTFRTMSMSRVLRWKNYMNDYDYTLQYVQGEKNMLADTFSRLPRMDKISVGDKELKMIKQKKGKLVDFKALQPAGEAEDEVFLLSNDSPQRIDSYNECSSSKTQPDLFPTICNNDDCLLIECLLDAHIALISETGESYLNIPSFRGLNNPLTMINIQNYQKQDMDLITRFRNDPAHYTFRTINGTDLMCHRKHATENWKICLPLGLVHATIEWYHFTLGHCGQERLYDTINARFHHPGLSVSTKAYVCPVNCHMYKNQGKSYGHHAPRHARLVPWNECAVDLIGPWKIQLGEKELTFKALTIIDPVTNLLEIVRIDNKSSKHVAQQFANVWLSRYPWPTRVIHDNGTEFMGEFQHLLLQLGIKSVPTTVKNPQSNAIIERVHKTMGDVLRVLLHTSPPETLNDTNRMVENALATVQHACRVAVNHTMRTSPGAMVFNRDMLLNIPLIANLEAIRDRRQHLINENLRRANAKRIEWNYNINDRVMMVEYDPTKLDAKTHGPYLITRVFTNHGTVRIQRKPHVQETVNIRKIYPYKGNEHGPPNEA